VNSKLVGKKLRQWRVVGFVLSGKLGIFPAWYFPSSFCCNYFTCYGTRRVAVCGDNFSNIFIGKNCVQESGICFTWDVASIHAIRPLVICCVLLFGCIKSYRIAFFCVCFACTVYWYQSSD